MTDRKSARSRLFFVQYMPKKWLAIFRQQSEHTHTQKLHLHGGMNMNGLHYILVGEQRKQMAQVILEIIQEKVVYKRVPTCAYQIGSFTISKDGVLSWTDWTLPRRNWKRPQAKSLWHRRCSRQFNMEENQRTLCWLWWLAGRFAVAARLTVVL